MNIIEITPPKQLNFSIPNDMHRVLTLNNLTLQSVSVLIIKSHPYEMSLSQQSFLLQGFEQKKIDICLNWNQQGVNLSVGKLRIYYEEVEEELTEDRIPQFLVSQKSKNYFEELGVSVCLDTKDLRFLNYSFKEQEGSTICRQTSKQTPKKLYLMKRISHLFYDHQRQSQINLNCGLKNEILTYLQHLPEVISIQPYQLDGSYLVEFNQSKVDSCELVDFEINQEKFVFAIRRIVSYGKTRTMPTLIKMQEGQGQKKDFPVQNTRKREIQPKKQIVKQLTKQVNISELRPRLTQKQQIFKKELVKQSFMGKRQFQKVKSRRKNKSEEKIIQNSSQDETELFKEQMRQIKQLHINQNKPEITQVYQQKKQKVKKITYGQTNIEFTQKVLNAYIETKQKTTQIYVILRDCVRCFILEQPQVKKIIKFDAIYPDNLKMPCPVQKYKDELIFANETSLFWLNVQTGENQWRYVQRKYIYSLAVIDQLSLVVVGGKIFSKLSYFGKQTNRSNIKLYSCSSSDKHDHLYTYDFVGDNVGNIMNMAYVTTPPHGTKLLIIHTLNSSNQSNIYFLRVKAFNKIQIFGQVSPDELGIINLLKFKYNKQSARLISMEALGETQMDCFKKLKLKCQYQKVEVFTESIKIPLKRYISFQLGGSKEGQAREWMSLVDQNGSLVHTYDFQSKIMQDLELGKGEIRQIFSVYNGRYTIICTDLSIRIRQRTQVQEQE